MNPDAWYAVPTANVPQCGRTFAAWKDQGYLTAALLDAGSDVPANADVAIWVPKYPGWPTAAAILCNALDAQYGASIIVTGGDDMLPDPHQKAGEIAAGFVEHFPDLFGVMQPTGDRWMPDQEGTVAAERICGSPWMGRSLWRSLNGGRGPFWPGYYHFYADEEMHDVAGMLGILWQRPDLCQHHDHWIRRGDDRPEYLEPAKAAWGADQQLFFSRKAAGFPGHERATYWQRGDA